MIIDDPIKSASDIGNPDIRKMMQDNWNAVIAPTMFEGGRAICLGTRFRHDDIHSTTFCQQNNWMQIVLSAILNNDVTGEEESYWPEMWSLEYLKEKKRQAPIAFSFQYMNQIVRQNELSLAPELLVKAEIATEFDTLGIGVDLSAGTKEKNDYTVMILGGRIGDKIHIIDYRRLRVMGNLEKLDALKELLNDWSVIGKQEDGLYFPTYSTCDIWSEAVQYQASLEADFKRICLNGEGLYNLIWHPVQASFDGGSTFTAQEVAQGFFFGPQAVGVGVGGPNAQVLINNNDDFSRFIILIWQLYAGFETLNKDFITTGFSFVADDGDV